jgi:glycosyltransferase involved in cell wall biosynthesis
MTTYPAWVNKEANNRGVHPAYLQAAYADGKGSALPSWMSLSGVNVAGYLTAELGVGEAGRGYIKALKSLGVQTALTDFAAGTRSRKKDNTLTGFSSTNPYPLNLICINADQVPNFMKHVGFHYFEQKYNIGVWWWELPDFPKEWRQYFTYFNELWVGSVYTYESVSRHSPIPVFKIPPVVQVQLPHAYQKKYFGLADNEFIFLFVFDFLSLFERKNPLAVVEAFKKAFSPDEPVRLVLKCINGEHDSINFKRLKDAVGDARITIIESYLSKDEKNGLINACNCYVSLHRSEGFGLTLAEAMFLEKPAIATGWSGNMDFMTVNNSYPVEYELTSIKADYGPYKQGQTWAEPSIQHAAQLMRRVYEQPEEANKKAKRAAADIRLMHSPAAVAELVKARLDVIQSSLSIVAKGPVTIPPSLPLEMITGSKWATVSRYGKLGRLVKRVIKRLIRFYIVRQDTINRYLLASNQSVREQAQQQQSLVNELERQIAYLEKRVEALQAETQQGLASNQSIQEEEQQTLV